MSFKVVFINLLMEVEPVPYQWEENGVVWWPITKGELKRHQSNPNSVPDKIKWKCYECKLKDTDILMYHDAVSRANYYCSFENSDAEFRAKNAREYQRKHPNTSNSGQRTYSNFLNTITISEQNSQAKAVSSVNIDPITTYAPVFIQQENFQNQTEPRPQMFQQLETAEQFLKQNNNESNLHDAIVDTSFNVMDHSQNITDFNNEINDNEIFISQSSFESSKSRI